MASARRVRSCVQCINYNKANWITPLHRNTPSETWPTPQSTASPTSSLGRNIRGARPNCEANWASKYPRGPPIPWNLIWPSLGTPLSDATEERDWRKLLHRGINVRNRNPLLPSHACRLRCRQIERMRHTATCPKLKTFWDEVFKFCRRVLHAPSPVERERAIIFNQWSANALGPPMACAFIRHAYGNMYHDFSLVDTQGRPFNWVFTFAKTLRRFRSAVNEYGEEIRRFHISRRYSALTEPDFHGPRPGRQRVDKVSEETRTQFVALLTISRDDHSFSLTQAFTDAIDTAERRETAERNRPTAAVPPPPARAAPPGGGGGAPGPP